MITKTNINTANYFALPGMKFGFKFYENKSAENILNVVCKFLEVKRYLLNKRTRKGYIVKARQIAMFLIKKHTDKNLTEIGQLFNGRDHTTAVHSIQKVNQLCKQDEQYKQRLLQIENLL